eukprot:GHRR01015341.1.p1 GENE.GHRR01015341.1~~GHRR01015341.1.p1  ORF type:complete len:117 (+),score=17.47 GHRR01015341.1:425-775(+)
MGLMTQLPAALLDCQSSSHMTCSVRASTCQSVPGGGVAFCLCSALSSAQLASKVPMWQQLAQLMLLAASVKVELMIVVHRLSAYITALSSTVMPLHAAVRAIVSSLTLSVMPCLCS